MNLKNYLACMATFWLGFGLVNTFYPALHDTFLSQEGLNASTLFSDHIFLHGGLCVFSQVVLLIGLSKENISKRMIFFVSLSALGPTIAITYSLLFTPYWTPLFLGAGLATFAFFIWGYAISVNNQ